MTTNKWIEFIKDYRKKHPGMKYGDLLIRASKSPEWIRYKQTHKNKEIDNDDTNNDDVLTEIRNTINKINDRLSIIEKFIKK
jgi:hypothetical protein